MNKFVIKKLSFLPILIIGLISASVSVHADPVPEKIGVVNFEKILSQHPSKDAVFKIEDQLKALSSEFEKKANDVAEKKIALDQDLPKLSKDDAEKRKKELNDMFTKLDDDQSKAEKKHEQLMKEYQDKKNSLLTNITDAIKQYSTANGFTIVLDSRTVTYALDEKDITSEIIKNLKPIN